MPITEDLLKKFGITEFEDIEKEEDGTFKAEKAIERVFKHGQDMKAVDPDLIKSLKSEGVKEGSIIANKKFVKTFREKFGLDFSNKDINNLDASELAEMVQSIQSSKNTDDVNKIQAELIKIANEKKSLEDRYESDINNIRGDYEEKERVQNQKNTISKIFRNPESKFIVTEDTALLIFQSKLKEDGFTIRFEDGKSVVYKGESKALTDNKTSNATVEYLCDKYWSEIKQISNGSGGNNQNASKQHKEIELSDKFKALESKYSGKRGG